LTFYGGLIWALSGFCAFTATHKLGIARAFGIWAPLNILVSMIWGAVLFHELVGSSLLNLVLLGVSLAVIIAGALLIIFAKGSGEAVHDRKDLLAGLAGAVGAGVLWGTYFIPIKMTSVSLWAAALPLAAGIFAGSAALALLAGQSPRLASGSQYLRVSATGLLWGIGNYGMLLLVGEIGAGKGFTISQLSVVVNGLIAVYWLKDPSPRSRAASLTLAGCVLATLGGIVLGNLK
ncbi:MAG TPA: GRP family sugar transporter, partial [Anaerolineales bacterium]